MEWFNPKSHIDFMRLRRISAIFSLSLMLLSLVFISTRGIYWGLDFTGGTVVELNVPSQQVFDLDTVRERLDDGGFNQAIVQYYGSEHDISVRLGVNTIDEIDAADAALVADEVFTLIQQDYPQLTLLRTDIVGAQVGAELAEKGLMALVVAVLLTAVYVAFRFEYRFAVSAAVALAHDPILILGIFALLQIEFDLATLAAILAAIGYSLNDTIVIFDRVRENFIKMRKATPIQVMNAAINQTLSRTIITSALTLLVVLVLLLFGGQSVFGFALALLIGIVIGTYSSIYVAGALAITMGLTRQDLLPPEKGEEEAVL